MNAVVKKKRGRKRGCGDGQKEAVGAVEILEGLAGPDKTKGRKPEKKGPEKHHLDKPEESAKKERVVSKSVRVNEEPSMSPLPA